MTTETENLQPPDGLNVNLRPEDVLGSWKVERRIGEGGCGVIYRVRHVDNHDRVGAMKVEPTSTEKDDEILRMETLVINAVYNLKRDEKTPEERQRHVVQMLDAGKDLRYNFIVMQLLGPNLADLRRACPDQKFTLSTGLRLGQQCLYGLREVHDAGFVHRDVKPSNYAIGPKGTPSARMVFLLDFGLARSWRLKDTKSTKGWSIRRPRTDVPFRGTPRYCSTNVHLRKEQGRHDDLWSWVYVLLEMITGQLPWRNQHADAAYQTKMSATYRQLKIDTLTCRHEIVAVIRSLRPLNYKAEPPYDLINQQLDKALSDRHISANEPLDWEQVHGRLAVMDITDRSEIDCSTGISSTKRKQKQAAARTAQEKQIEKR